jgi:hypothetical protein
MGKEISPCLGCRKEKRNCDSIYNDSSKKKKGECVVTANIRIPYGIFISDW